MQAYKENISEISSPASNWQIYRTPAETWDAMYEDCAKAKKSIEFEQYILDNDPVGHRFLELFIRKAKEGLKIKIICDAYGSRRLIKSSLINTLRQSGGSFHFYRALSWWDIICPWRWFPRTHAKTLLVDSEIAYTGGVCMAERMENWRDTHVRIAGPVVQQVRKAFDDMQQGMSQQRRRFLQIRKSRHSFYYLEHQPDQAEYPLYDSLLKAIEQSQSSILIETAFFIPGKRFLRMLKQAAERGVDVRIIMPERSDVKQADWVRLSYGRELLAAGIRVLLYRPTVLHSKTAVIDRNWVSIGSMNMDVLSFFHNREANLITKNPAFADELYAQFMEDMEQSVEMTEEYLQAVPGWQLLLGYLGRIFKILL